MKKRNSRGGKREPPKNGCCPRFNGAKTLIMVNVNASPIPCALRSIPRPRTAAPRHGLPSAGKRRRGRLSFPVMTFLLLLILFTATAARAEKVVVVGGDQAYPPYEFLDQDGHPAGYNVELTRAIAEVMGVKVQIRLGDWEEMRKALADGSIDILEGMVYSKERARKFDFSPPHSFVNESVFARKGAQPVTSLEQLRGKEVIVQRGGFSHDYLVNKHVGAKLILVETHREALRLLAAGKGDYALVGNLPGLYLGRKLGLSNVVPVGKPFSGQPYGYAVKKGNEKILAQFSEGLALLKKTGRQQQIYDRWLGPLEPRGIPWKKIVLVGGMVFGPLLIVLGGIVVWNRSLKKEVERRTRDLQLQQQQLIQADKMASLGILVSGVAHEINNPTGLILYNLPVLSKAYQVAEAGPRDPLSRRGGFHDRRPALLHPARGSAAPLCRDAGRCPAHQADRRGSEGLSPARKPRICPMRSISTRWCRPRSAWSRIPSRRPPAASESAMPKSCRRCGATPSASSRWWSTCC